MNTYYIYALINVENEKIICKDGTIRHRYLYIGSSKNPKNRYKKHKNNLENNVDHYEKL